MFVLIKKSLNQAQNNWHIHRDGLQILLTDGEGWRGPTEDSWVEHIAITAGKPDGLSV